MSEEKRLTKAQAHRQVYREDRRDLLSRQKAPLQARVIGVGCSVVLMFFLLLIGVAACLMVLGFILDLGGRVFG